ncbi:TetR/AcrR family transcriptional regulator [Mycolicibacterium vaccae]|uniref:TetR family transcriptional regulator n=1 Tax=Mycolicibacterium vaccae ATCC 25954 TaxID=1194972 RepID=K0V3K8_MYCVA|nr:TetR/AcrR family transcriptional regulator [Mycolicibacterium vaccae]ANI38770.1 TetR family transcriptional regulator [Mycolicibacterium vaccae 95051]EJZ05634.1 TetR family transcriptional regulator [Mycolicibacterium vaccae ATCC 25954]MCV7063625.1 TetR/AcrR family transcriptional regulator [Mycolicibacterium vaccae]
MTAKPPRGATPRRSRHKSQERADRTRELVIEETIRCIREEGFSAASTRHIIERAGVSTGVVQYHFGDRDGLLTAVIDHAITTLVTSINDLANEVEGITDTEQRMKALADAAWKVFLNPASLTAMEILIATRSLRSSLGMEQLASLQPGLERIAQIIGTPSPHATAITDLLWAAPMGLMVGQMVADVPVPTEPQRQAMAQLMIDHLRANQESAAPRGRKSNRKH